MPRPPSGTAAIPPHPGAGAEFVAIHDFFIHRATLQTTPELVANILFSDGNTPFSAVRSRREMPPPAREACGAAAPQPRVGCPPYKEMSILLPATSAGASMRYLAVSLAMVGIMLSGPALADTVVYSNNFDAGPNQTLDLSGSGSIVTAPSGEIFMGDLGEGGSETLTLTGLPSHNRVDIAFTLDAIGSVDGNVDVVGGGVGDYFDVTANSTNVFNYSFANYGNSEKQSYPTDGSAPGTGAAGTNTLGFFDFPEGSGGFQDSIYDIVLDGIVDSSGDLTITFTGNTNEALSNEYYGFDNLQVSVGSVTPPASVPEPPSIGLLFSGLLLIGAYRVQSRRKPGPGAGSDRDL